jgi:hypothetical protein
MKTTTVELVERWQAAKMARVHPRVIDTWVEQGHLQTVKLDMETYIVLRDLQALVGPTISK